MYVCFPNLYNLPGYQYGLPVDGRTANHSVEQHTGMAFILWLSTKVTGEPLTPTEVREIVAYVNTYREKANLFDVAVYGETSADQHKGATLVQSYREAGATWWIEAREAFEELRERIRQGPPKGL